MKVILVALSLTLTATVPSAQLLSEQEIAAAIEQGRAGKTLHKTCKASGENGFDIVVEGPVGRIMRAARLAKSQGREYTPAEVSLAIGGPEGPWLTVAALRDATLTTAANALPSKEMPGHYVPSSTSMTDRPRSGMLMGEANDSAMAIRSKVTDSHEAQVLASLGRLGGRGYWIWSKGGPNAFDRAAAFDLAAFRALPVGDVEVVVFATNAGERRCKISEKERKAIR